MAKNNNLTDFLTDVANAIREKEGSGEAINPQAFSSRILALQTGGGGGGGLVPAKDVNFRDYDGTILHSYSKDAFLALSELPALPSRAGLICQEWNWNLDDAKSYVEEYGMLEIGATYTTDDGRTRLYISIVDDTDTTLTLVFTTSVSDALMIDWGDGNIESVSGTKVTATHEYNSIGNYVIALEVAEGQTILFGQGSQVNTLFKGSIYHANLLHKVEIGRGVKEIPSYSFTDCHSLQLISIPKGVTSMNNSSFSKCYSLKALVFPSGLTSTFSYVNTFYSLEVVLFPNVKITNTGNNYLMAKNALKQIILPNGLTSLPSYAFDSDFRLKRAILPNTITSISTNMFNNCTSLMEVHMPHSITALPNNFVAYCYSLPSFEIPSGVTSIGQGAFTYCESLNSLRMPSGITTIGTSAFSYCKSLKVVDFRNHTSVPTLSGTNAFSNVNTGCKIIVPDELYDSWIAATNWSNSTIASKIIKASEYNG